MYVSPEIGYQAFLDIWPKRCLWRRNVVFGPMERLLVSTAMEETWGDGEPVLFLGEWCLRYSRMDQWSNLDSEVLPSHWDDRAKLKRDRQMLAGMHEVLLAELAAELNERHDVNHGLRYWRILLGPWLGYFVQTLFDRWATVQAALNFSDLSRTVSLFGLEDARVPKNMEDYLHLGNGQQWNHFLFSRVLAESAGIQLLPLESKGGGQSTSADEDGWGEAPMGRLHWLARVASRGSRYLTRATDVSVVNACFGSLRDELRLQRLLGQVPTLAEIPRPVSVAPKVESRHWQLGVSTEDEFEAMARRLIVEFLPTAYLEGYRALCDQVDGLRLPKRPSTIVTSASHFYDDLYKAWCGKRVEDGSSLVIGQHGGHVGIGWSFHHDHQVDIADRFLSWGWTDPENPKVESVGMLKELQLPDTEGVEPSRAVLAMGNELAHLQYLSSSALSSQFLSYLEEQYEFVDALSPAVRDALIVRLTKYDFEWEQILRWGDRHPKVALDDGQRPILDLLAESRLFVSTNNGTTFLESISLDVPTVIFWNTEMWELTEIARPAFKRLSAVGVFFDNPIEAARHVSEVWDDVGSWWADADVREAVEAFSFQFCRRSPDVVDEVRRVLVEDGWRR